MSLNAKLILSLVATLTDPADLSTPTDELEEIIRATLTSGVGTDQGNMMWHDERTLAASATEDLDLAGSLTNSFGDTQTFARVKLIIVIADEANVNNVNVQRAAANGVPLFLAASDGVAVRPNGVFLYFAPDATAIAVTAGTGDLLTITNSGSGTSVTYKVIIIGASA